MDNRGPSNPDPSVPTLIVEGLVLFGGVGIKNQATLKERWLAFAEQFKGAFGPLHHNYYEPRRRRRRRCPHFHFVG